MKPMPALLAVACLAWAACDDGVREERDSDPGAAPAVTESAAAGQAADTGEASSPAAGETAGGTTIRVAGRPITVEVADAPDERERGLMGRDSLPPDHGMLFVYGEERELSFWMRNTRIPLDIAFIDRGGTIVDIQQMEPESDSYHTSRRPAMYALEMSRGWFREHGVSEGDRVSF